MPPRKNSTVFRHQPKGCSDSQDETASTPGLMRQLQNLVPAPDTTGHWVPRPAMTQLAGTPAAITGFVSCSMMVGNYWFGMVATGSGTDYPVCYNVATNSVVTITGALVGNTPNSPATSGTWTPPQMAVIGKYIIVCSAGFTTANNFGAINIATITAPVWTMQTTATFALPATPVWVMQFFDRAYYVCNPVGGQPALVASDALDPLTCTNAAYVLTFGDNVPIVAAAPLGLNNQVVGGQIQSMIVFKQNLTLFQVTGDFTLTGTQAIQINALNVATGTYAPNTITQTPYGLAFIAPDGLRSIGFQADVSPTLGLGGTGIDVPFISSTVPSRMNASCNANTIRITTINGSVTGSPTQEWCYDLTRKIWHGPHTSWFDQIVSWGNTFVIYRGDQTGLYLSDIIPSNASTYTEFGSVLNCVYQTCLLPERQDMRQCSMYETIFYQGSGVSQTYSVSALDQNNSVIQYVSIAGSGLPTVWDSFTWGSGLWLGGQQVFAVQTVPWTSPVVFDRMSIQISFPAVTGARIGDIYMYYQLLGYTSRP